MPRLRLDGGVIGSLNTPSLAGAGGIWTLKDNEEYTRRGLWPIASNPVGSINVAALVVAGGGGGGWGWGGGGGGGGVTYTPILLINTNINYPVIVGAGGTGSTTSSIRGSNGTSSSFNTITTVGGGGGGSWDSAGSYPSSLAPFVGYAGGSGGGASSKGNTGGANTIGQGYAGGSGSSDNSSYDGGGGGGGAGAVGGNGGSSGGAGGSGLSFNFANGTPIAYAGGGGGGSTGTAGAAGSGGGAVGGGTNSTAGGNANTGYGGGGGGGSASTAVAGGNGGSGTVIISYPLPQIWTGGKVTNNNGTNVVHTFTSSGTMTALSTPIDTYQPYNTLLLHADGTNGANNSVFLDSSTNNLTVTKNGTPTQGTFSPFSTTGWSTYFNTATDYIKLTPTSALSLPGSGDFTFEGWVYTNYNNVSLVFKDGRAGTNYPDYDLGINSSNQMFWYGGNATGASGYVQTIASTNTVPLSQWNHLAYVRQNMVWSFYINGVYAGGGTQTQNTTPTNNYFYFTTQEAQGPANAGTFYFSNFRIITNQAVYKSNFTPPTTPLQITSNTQLLVFQNNTFKDNGPSNFALAATGTPQVQPFSPFSPTAAYSNTVVGGSMYFNGSTDYLTIPYSSNLDLGTGDFTLEAWVYPTSAPGAGTPILGSLTTGGMDWNWRDSTHLAIGNNSVTYLVNSAAATFNTNSWNHVSASRTSGVTYFWLNGNSIGSQADPYIHNAASNPLYVGRSSDGYFTGYISNLRVVKGTGLYTTAFTPSTAPLTPVANTALLLNATNAGIIDSSQKNELITYGSASISTAQSKFGGSSMYFDGSSGYLTTFNTYTQFGTGDFTVECWTYLTSKVTAYPCIFSNYNSYSAGSLALFAGHNSGTTTAYQVSYNGSTFPTSINGGTINYNTWVHLALVRYGSVITLYVNGSSVGTITSATASINGVGSNFYIGTSGDNLSTGYIAGYIDDIRITKGYARYTANFIPPTTAFLNT